MNRILSNLFVKGTRTFGKAKIATKIIIYYLIILIFSITLSSVMYQKIYSNMTSKKVSDVSFQTLHLINSNINSLVNVVDSYSQMLLANEAIQSTLINMQDDSNLETRRTMFQYMNQFIGLHFPISSIYIFDNRGNKYAADKSGTKLLNYNSISEASWYDRVVGRKGGYILEPNGQEIFKGKTNENYISLIRTINDINTQVPIGTIIVNIPERSIVNAYKEIVRRYKTDIMIIDEDNNDIIASNRLADYNIEKLINESDNKEHDSIIQKVNGSLFLLSYIHTSYDWKIISVMPFEELSKESSMFNIITLVIIVLNSILMFVGVIFISRLITNPISKLLKLMKGIEKGEFKKIEIRTSNDEIDALKKGYNRMVQEIQALIEKIMKEQKIKRKAELNALQAQIKPHFLYNTFDAISSLALLGRNQDVYSIMKALGTFYRTSLNKGNEVITIGEEIVIVEKYLHIQKIRYRDEFSYECHVDTNANKYSIPKLVLQPLVENALYHGIRCMDKKGTIKITVNEKIDTVVLTVSDDGKGIDEDILRRLNDDKIGIEKASFGLRGTRERLRIFYGNRDVLKIMSDESGTTIMITIPKMLKGEDGIDRYDCKGDDYR